MKKVLVKWVDAIIIKLATQKTMNQIIDRLNLDDLIIALFKHRVRNNNQVIASQIIIVKKGKVRYKLLITTSKNGHGLRFNLGRHYLDSIVDLSIPVISPTK